MRPEIAAHRRRARLVEQRQALVDPACLDVGSSLAGKREHLHVAIAYLPSELVGVVEELDGALQVTLREQCGDGVREYQPAMLGRRRQTRQKALGARDPATGDRKRAAGIVVPARA